MVKSIFLQDGEEIFVDDEDYERVNQHTWHKSFNGNHRMVMNNESLHLITFIKKDGYQMIKNNDFTRKNITTDGNKNRWSKARYNNSSKYKGVSWDKENNKWYAKIRINGQHKYLGRYSQEDKAGLAYNNAVLKYLDGKAYMNEIGQDNRMKENEYKTHKNQLNRRSNQNNLRGIRKRGFKFYPRIVVKNKEFSLGGYHDVNKARLTFNKCMSYLYGKDAILNNVPMTDELKEFISNWEIPDRIKALKEGAENEQ